MMTTQAPDGYRFEVLDGMRGIGSFIVLIGHGSLALFYSADSAVDMFFLHSGFILAYTSWQRAENPNFVTTFILHRLIRILPIYFAGMALGFVAAAYFLYLGDPDWTLKQLLYSGLLSAFMLPYLIPGSHAAYPTNIVAWSLFFELFINLVVPFTRFRLVPAIAISILSLPFLLLCYHYWFEAGGPMTNNFFGGFARVFYSFFAGVVIFHISRSRFTLPFNIPWWLCWIILIVMYTPKFESNYYVAFLTIVAQPLLFYMFTNAKMSGWTAKFASWLGLISYALYIVHVPIQEATTSAFAYYDVYPWGYDPVVWAWVIAAPFTVALAHLMTFQYDVPVRRYLNGLVRRRMQLKKDVAVTA